MADLGIPRNTIEVLQRHHFTFQKKYGQNFLIDPNVLDRPEAETKPAACWRSAPASAP